MATTKYSIGEVLTYEPHRNKPARNRTLTVSAIRIDKHGVQYTALGTEWAWVPEEDLSDAPLPVTEEEAKEIAYDCGIRYGGTGDGLRAGGREVWIAIKERGIA